MLHCDIISCYAGYWTMKREHDSMVHAPRNGIIDRPPCTYIPCLFHIHPHDGPSLHCLPVVNLWGKRFKLHNKNMSLLTIDHSCKIFFWYLPNWTSTDLWCVVQGVSHWNEQSNLALTGIRIDNFIDIMCSANAWGYDILIFITIFQKSNIGWPQ